MHGSLGSVMNEYFTEICRNLILGNKLKYAPFKIEYQKVLVKNRKFI